MGHIPKISESEWLVMKAIWAENPITSNRVVEVLTGSTAWKPKTIKTLLNRLRRISMITYYKRFSRKMTLAAFALLISTGFILFALSGFAEVKQGQTGEGADIGKAHQLNELDTPPAAIYEASPLYPFVARRENIEGKVWVRFVVTKEGTVRDASIYKSTPAGVFDESALKTIMQWRFEPGIKDGEAVDSLVIQAIAFVLE